MKQCVSDIATANLTLLPMTVWKMVKQEMDKKYNASWLGLHNHQVGENGAGELITARTWGCYFDCNCQQEVPADVGYDMTFPSSLGCMAPPGGFYKVHACNGFWESRFDFPAKEQAAGHFC